MRGAAQRTDGNRPRATAWRRSRLAVEIAAALVVKFVLLLAIWAAWFSHPARPNLDERTVAAAVLGAAHGTAEPKETPQ